MPRIYIAGPMTGYPDFNFPAFHHAAADWRAAGWDVVNPAEAFDGRQDLAYRDYVKHDLAVLRTCDAVALLPGWDGQGARGSVWEAEIAHEFLHIPRFMAEDVVPPENVQTGHRESALQEAQRLVHGDRGAAYGHPYDDYTRTTRMWEALLGLPEGFIGPRKGAVMMALVKASREANQHKRDNLVDMAGYAECAQMIAEREESN